MQRFTSAKSIALFGIVIPLSGCNITTPTAGPTVFTPNGSYEEFESTAVQQSALTGRTLQIPATPSATSPAPTGSLSGTLQHDTRVFSIGNITDSDGPTTLPPNTQIITDDTSGQNGILSGNLSYVKRYDTGNPTEIGYIGIATIASDMPVSGQATFTGNAFGDTTLLTSRNDIPTTLTANYGPSGGSVDASISITEGGVTETIDVTNMTIAGTGFSGGTIAVVNNGAAVDVSSNGFTAEGNFYGFDTAAGGPAEVGAIFSAQGPALGNGNPGSGIQLIVVAD